MNCGNGYCMPGSRSFLTKEEKIDLLREYKDELDNESKGVAERITQLEKDG